MNFISDSVLVGLRVAQEVVALTQALVAASTAPAT